MCKTPNQTLNALNALCHHFPLEYATDTSTHSKTLVSPTHTHQVQMMLKSNMNVKTGGGHDTFVRVRNLLSEWEGGGRGGRDCIKLNPAIIVTTRRPRAALLRRQHGLMIKKLRKYRRRKNQWAWELIRLCGWERGEKVAREGSRLGKRSREELSSVYTDIFKRA